MFWQKLGSLKPIFNKKCVIFSITFLPTYDVVDYSETISKLIKDKKK